MTPDDIRALRKRLKCTMQELASALGVDNHTVMAWEDAEMFPTKRFVDRMRELDEGGASKIVRSGRRRAKATSPLAALADPELWRLLRKLIAYPALREQAEALAAGYDDISE